MEELLHSVTPYIANNFLYGMQKANTVRIVLQGCSLIASNFLYGMQKANMCQYTIAMKSTSN